MPWTQGDAVLFGQRLRKHRESVSLSQEELASLAGVAKNLVQLLESGRPSPGSSRGHANPRISTVYDLADALRLDPSSLLGFQ